MTRLSDENKVINFGSALKTTGDGYTVEGYLVLFGNPDERDFDGDYFTAETDYGIDWSTEEAKSAVYWNHGLDEGIGLERLCKGQKAKLGMDDKGIWIEARLAEGEEYDERVKELIELRAAKSRPPGWSSGTGGHLVEKVEVRPGAFWVKRWPLGLDASITHTPNDYRNIATLKTYAEMMHTEADAPTGASDAATVTGDRTQTKITSTSATGTNKGTRKMSIKQKKADGMADDEEKSDDMLIGAVDEEKAANAMAALSAKMDEVLELLAERLPGMNDEEKSAAKEAMTEEAEKADITEEVDTAKALRRFEKSLSRMVETAVNAVHTKREKTRSAFNAAYDKAAAARPGTSKTAGLGLGSGHQISVSEPLKYADLSASDMALGLSMLMTPMKQAGFRNIKMGDVASEEYLNVMAHKMRDFAMSEPYKGDSKGNNAIKSTLHPAIKVSDAFDASSIVGQGAEWVGEFWSTDVWRRARFERVYDRLVSKGMMVKEIPSGYDTAHFPTEGSDPVVYTAPQANDTDSTGRPEVTAYLTPFGTGTADVTPKEQKLATAVTVILEEDAIVNIVAQVNYQINEAMLESRDRTMINGDTATAINTNINLIDGTPATGLQTPYYITTDGFRKLPLVTNTAAARTAGGSLTLTDYRKTLARLSAELRQYRDRLMFIIDPDTETATLGLPELATDDVRRTNATITAGVLENVYGIDVASSGFLPLSNTAGKVNGTNPSTLNIYGTILLVYAPYWGFAYKRQITVETGRDILSGTNIWVASVRMGMVPRGTNAAALTYGVGVSST